MPGNITTNPDRVVSRGVEMTAQGADPRVVADYLRRRYEADPGAFEDRP